MSADHKVEDGWCNGALFIENTNRFPRDELARYAGKYVAWSLDGTRILASGDDYEALYRNVFAAGLRASQVVQSYLPGPEETTSL